MIHSTENNSTTCDNTKRGRQTTSADGENEQYCSTAAAAATFSG